MLINIGVFLAFIGFILVFLYLTVSGKTRISGRVMALIDPNYISDNMPLVSSVSEHAPSTWMTFY